jgi:protein associated with RNAse G/E
MNSIEIIKYDLNHIEQWRYSGKVVLRKPGRVIIEAYFDRSDVQVAGLLLSRHDRFLEIYFQDRWYNIYQVYAGNSSRIKGWYCNITRPPILTKTEISYIDLALDLVVLPDGEQTVLDANEFEQLDLQDHEKKQALAALEELQALVHQNYTSFNIIELN